MFDVRFTLDLVNQFQWNGFKIGFHRFIIYVVAKLFNSGQPFYIHFH